MDARNCLVSLASACSSFPDLVDLRNAGGDAAVHLAATFGRAAALRALLDQLGADPGAVVDREKKGRDEPLTPLEMASFYGYPGEKRSWEKGCCADLNVCVRAECVAILLRRDAQDRDQRQVFQAATEAFKNENGGKPFLIFYMQEPSRRNVRDEAPVRPLRHRRRPRKVRRPTAHSLLFRARGKCLPSGPG